MIVVEVTTVVVEVCCECARLCADSSLIVHGCALMMALVHAHDTLKTVKVECIDVDDASSSAPPTTLLRESDHYPTHHVDR